MNTSYYKAGLKSPFFLFTYRLILCLQWLLIDFVLNFKKELGVKSNYLMMVMASSLLVITNLMCMEKNIFPSRQKVMRVPCFDGIYELETWKAVESISLYKHCLRYDKSFELREDIIEVPKFCVSYEAIKLFSNALDMAPGKQFADYFHQLTAAQKRTLIIAAGKLDENKKRQFNSPALVAQITELYFNSEWLDKNIKPFLQKTEWSEYCRNKVIDNNLRTSSFDVPFFAQKAEVKADDRGLLSIITAGLVGEKFLYNGPYDCKKEWIGDSQFYVFAYKKIGNWEQYLTAFEPVGSVNDYARNDKIIIWVLNKVNKIIEKTVVEHKSFIRNCFFSKNGQYVITHSLEYVFVSKIIHKEDGACTFNTYCVDHNERIFDVYFSNQFNRLITWSKGDRQEIKLVEVSGKCIATMIDNGVTDKIVLSPDGSQLLVFSKIYEKQSLRVCAVSDSLNFNGIIIMPAEINFSSIVVCSPNNEYWAITTKDGDIILLSALDTECKIITLVKRYLINSGEGIMRMLFSFDSRLLIALLGKLDCKFCRIEGWSTRNGEKAFSINFCLMDKPLDYGIWLTSNDREFIVTGNEKCLLRKSFCGENDDKILKYLLNSTTLYEFSVLRRLYAAHKNKETIELYQEGSAHKALDNLPKKPLNIVEFLKKYLPWKIIDNKKSIIRLGQETWNNFFS